MTLTGAFVLYAVIWFITFLIMLQLRPKTQGDIKNIVRGTPPGAPHEETVGRKALNTTFVAILLWAPIVGIIWSEVISIRDIDLFYLISSSAQK